MKKSELYAALRREIHRHDFSTFIERPLLPSHQAGEAWWCLADTSTCKKRIGTAPQFSGSFDR